MVRAREHAMLKQSKLGRIAFSVACGLSLAVFLQSGTAGAKLSAAPGPDGAPPDPETEAAVDALNDALDGGPDEGQSVESWIGDIEAAHDALFGSTTLVSSTPAVLDEGDMCESPVSLWMDSSSTQTVAQSLVDPAVRAELTDNVEEYAVGQLYLWLWGTNITFRPPQLTGLSCSQCTMTYVQCLLAGNGVDWCKRHVLNCSPAPRSRATFTLDVTAPFSGQITLQANLRYREIDEPESDLPYEYCIDVESFQTTGFGAFDVLIRSQLSPLVNEPLCGHAWDWSY
jgi:hypothetical protein